MLTFETTLCTYNEKKKCLEFILLVLINMTYIFGFPRRNDCENDSGHTH